MWFGIGLLGTLVVGFIVLLIIKAKKKNCKNYDERQIAAQGKAYKAGFLTFVACELIVFFTELFLEETLEIIAPGLLQIFILLISLFVYIEFLVFSDAYFSVGRPFDFKWCIIMLLLGVCYIIQFINSEDDWYKYFALATGIFVILTIVSIMIKNAVNKKNERNLEDEESGESVESEE